MGEGGRRGIGKERMMEEVGGDREGREGRMEKKRASMYTLHGAKITSLSVPSTAPSKISPVYPPTPNDLEGNGEGGNQWKG